MCNRPFHVSTWVIIFTVPDGLIGKELNRIIYTVLQDLHEAKLFQLELVGSQGSSRLLKVPNAGALYHLLHEVA